MHRMKRITSMLDIEADRVDNAVGTRNGGLYGALVVRIGGDLFEAVYGSSPSRCGPERRTAAGQTWDLPVPVQGASAHARFFDHAGPLGPCDGASETCCLPHSKQRRHPGLGFRG